jgi:histidine triad (HIT) family protein
MKLNDLPFNKILSGEKDVEMRLGDPRRNTIRAGDVIEFSHRDNGEVILAAVTNVNLYADFSELYCNYDKKRLGYKEDDSADPRDMEEYYTPEEIARYGALAIEIIPLEKLTPGMLVDRGICPTCFDRNNNKLLYGDDSSMLICKKDDFVCFLAGNPRAAGHAVISSVVHYKDMSELPDELCKKSVVLARKLMNAIKEVYGCASVYMCTMCDGPMNHFHLQLIPRYADEKRGSSNFVKPRFEYLCDIEKLDNLRKIMKDV